MKNKKELAGYLQQIANPQKLQVLAVIEGKLANLPVVRIVRDPNLVKTERPYIDVDLAGYRHSLTGMGTTEVFTIGRADDADVSVQDYEDTSISRVHVIAFKKSSTLVVASVGGSGSILLDDDGTELPPMAQAEFTTWDKFLG